VRHRVESQAPVYPWRAVPKGGCHRSVSKFMEGESNHQSDDAADECWHCEIKNHKVIDFPLFSRIYHVIIALRQKALYMQNSILPI
jgi:hypothetical protein